MSTYSILLYSCKMDQTQKLTNDTCQMTSWHCISFTSCLTFNGIAFCRNFFLIFIECEQWIEFIKRIVCFSFVNEWLRRNGNYFLVKCALRCINIRSNKVFIFKINEKKKNMYLRLCTRQIWCFDTHTKNKLKLREQGKNDTSNSYRFYVFKVVESAENASKNSVSFNNILQSER